VDREGEAQQYEPFRDLHNRMLLWHGSRTTNFAGILSQGLRIAPPEAPVVSIIQWNISVIKLSSEAMTTYYFHSCTCVRAFRRHAPVSQKRLKIFE
jgi:hypothetical protein